jgi:hypothetical protein
VPNQLGLKIRNPIEVDGTMVILDLDRRADLCGFGDEMQTNR